MSFQQQCLDVHNEYRKTHGVPPLILNPTISQLSQSHAEELVKLNQLKLSTNAGYGENLYQLFNSDFKASPDAKQIVKKWYDEIKLYTFSKEPSDITGTGNFTQIVWKGSMELGVGMATDNKGNWYVVCNYYPPGNMQGQHVKNVFPAK